MGPLNMVADEMEGRPAVSAIEPTDKVYFLGVFDFRQGLTKGHVSSLNP